MTHEGILKGSFAITRRRLGQAGAALGLLAAAGRAAAADATPEVFYSPEVSAEALLRI